MGRKGNIYKGNKDVAVRLLISNLTATSYLSFI